MTYLQQRQKEAHELSVNPVLHDHHGQRDGQHGGALHEMRHGQIRQKSMRAVTIQFIVDDVVHEQQIGENAENR